VLWGPYASAAAKEAGGELFEHVWTPNDPLAHGDGLGPVFNGNSCVACHFQGGVGGGGGREQNVTSFTALPTKNNAEMHSGLIHAFAVQPGDRESVAQVRLLYPIVKGSTRINDTGHCQYQVTIPDFDPVRTESVNSTALFGAGWIDRISSKAICQNRWSLALGNVAREFQLDFNNIPPGRPRMLPDGRVGKFGWKGQAASLQDFVASACANELGLGNPYMEQARSISNPSAGGSTTDMDATQFSNLLAFVDTLPCPVETTPEDPALHATAVRGKELFSGIGCAVCHTPDLGGVKRVYTDLLLHSVETGSDVPGGDPGYQEPDPEIPLPPDFPKASEWKTPALWGVADSAPYFHDGKSPTLRAAILRHGTDAKIVTEAFKKMTPGDQEALLAFLQTLKAPKDARSVPRGPVAMR
jgi:CxxC motif-containing protein (DUF1111 family)